MSQLENALQEHEISLLENSLQRAQDVPQEIMHHKQSEMSPLQNALPESEISPLENVPQSVMPPKNYAP